MGEGGSTQAQVNLQESGKKSETCVEESATETTGDTDDSPNEQLPVVVALALEKAK